MRIKMIVSATNEEPSDQLLASNEPTTVQTDAGQYVPNDETDINHGGHSQRGSMKMNFRMSTKTTCNNSSSRKHPNPIYGICFVLFLSQLHKRYLLIRETPVHSFDVVVPRRRRTDVFLYQSARWQHNCTELDYQSRYCWQSTRRQS